jgi:hypothetical protein
MGVPMWLNLNADTTGISIAQQGGRAGSRLIEQGTPCRFHLFPLRVSAQGRGYKDQSCSPRVRAAHGGSPSGHRRSKMKLDAATFLLLRRLAPVLDEVLNAGEVEHADQAVNLASRNQLCQQLFDAHHDQRPGEIAQAQLDALESQ